jgi:hypothetical protein
VGDIHQAYGQKPAANQHAPGIVILPAHAPGQAKQHPGDGDRQHFQNGVQGQIVDGRGKKAYRRQKLAKSQQQGQPGSQRGRAVIHPPHVDSGLVPGRIGCVG